VSSRGVDRQLVHVQARLERSVLGDLPEHVEHRDRPVRAEAELLLLLLQFADLLSDLLDLVDRGHVR